MNNLFPKGSEWRRWDLHFHSPSSYDYKNHGITNEVIIQGLIDDQIVAVAITDHHIIDTSKITKLQELAKTVGITVFPGIEFCGEMRGSDPIHFIGIFSETSDFNYIWGEISSKANIASQIAKGKKQNEIICNLIDTCKLIKNLGGITTIHAGSKSNTIENITNSLPVKMAQKKDIVEFVDIFEIGSKLDINVYKEVVFKSLDKDFPLIMGSDNHLATDYKPKEKCWIKANPTFEGLKQILVEPDRVFIGKEPPLFERIKTNKTKYLHYLNINKTSNYDGKSKGKWFDKVSVAFNPELVAIIGNKGSGKSAITDIIGLLTRSTNFNDFSFLSKNRFTKGNLAENFEATLTWLDGNKTGPINLNKQLSGNELEQVKYLPQQFFEKLCSDLDKSGAFEEELKNVVFNRLEERDKLGQRTFTELLEYKSKVIKDDLNKLEDELLKINTRIITLEKKSNPKYLEQVTSSLRQKELELESHAKSKPREVLDPSKTKQTPEQQQLFSKIEELNSRLAIIQSETEKIILKQSQITKEIEDLGQIILSIKNKKTELDTFKASIEKQITIHGVKIDEVIRYNLQTEPIEKVLSEKKLELDNINKVLYTEELIKSINTDEEVMEEYRTKSIIIQKKLLREQIIVIKEKLSEPIKEYQEYIENLKKWTDKELFIKGNEQNIDSLNYLLAEKKYVENDLFKQIKLAREDRLLITEKIFNKKFEIVATYQSIKKEVSAIIEKNQGLLKDYKITIEGQFNLKATFLEDFFSKIHQNVIGSFRGIGDGEKMLKEILDGKDINDLKALKEFLNTTIEYLDYDKRDNTNKHVHIDTQVKNPQELYRYLFSLDFLVPNYQLKLDGKDLIELSPGEKGALLLVYYLLLDNSDIPLIIDQPEDNLDNQSVYKILVPFIKLAKSNRQVILVTHNPNLAIAADAEQIIHVSINKSNKNEFKIESGSIEDPYINKKIVDILEGTMPAFIKRENRYQQTSH